MKEFDKKSSPSREGFSKFLPASMSDSSTRRRLTEYEIQLQDLQAYVRSLEATAEAGLAIGGTELGTAERSARSLITEAPYRESGYRVLMEVLAQRDNTAEALQAYEALRQRLRDDLGTAPSAGTQALHRQLLG